MIEYKPKVSVMIPTYNQEQYIAEAIESVLMQDYENLEIVISDDCSTDSTPEIIKKYLYDKRVKYVRNEPNLGRVGNYHNTLYKHTTGEWVVNLDGDDYYTDKHFMSEAIDNINKALQITDNISAYCFKQHSIEKAQKLFEYKVIDENCILVSGKEYFLSYYKILGFTHMNTIYSRKYATLLGDCYTKNYQASDFHAIIRIIMQGNIILDKRIIGRWRIHENNTTIKELNIKKIDLLKCYDDVESYAKNFFSSEEIIKWRKGMNRYAERDFASTHAYLCHNFLSVLLLLKTFRFKYVYFRDWYYLIFKH